MAMGLLSGVLLLVQNAPAEESKQYYDLSAGDAATTLRQLAEASGREVLFASEVVRGVRTNALRGEFTILEAFERMLAGTGLYPVPDEHSTAFAVRKTPESKPERRSASPRRAPRAKSLPDLPENHNLQLPEEPSKPMKQKSLIAVLSGILTFGGVQAQETGQPGAILRGSVSNQATGDLLGGATIRVEGTGRVTYTERDGSFVIRNIPPGPATVRVTYPGLDPVTTTVNFASGVTAYQDFALISDIYVLPEFAVAGFREGNAAAIARQEQAITSMNTVSSDAFGGIAKNNIGNVLKRLPGIVGDQTATNTESISIRGMDEEYTVINIDGTTAAGATEETEAFDGDRSAGRGMMLASIPAEFIESVEVIKTPTADMDADSLGGVVNLRTKSAFDMSRRTLRMTLGGSYNYTFGKRINPDSSDSQAIYPNFQLQYGDKYSVFGGENNLGIFLTANHEQTGELASTTQVVTEDWDFQGPTLPGSVSNPTDHRYRPENKSSFNAKVDYRLSEGSSLSFSGGYTKYKRNRDELVPRLAGPDRVVNLEESSDTQWVFDVGRMEITRRITNSDMQTWRWNVKGDHRLGTVHMQWDLTHSASREVFAWQGITRLITVEDIAFIWDRSNPKRPVFIQTGGRDITTNNMDNLRNQLSTLNSRHNFTTHNVMGAKFDIEKHFNAFKIKTGLRFRQNDREVTRHILGNGTNIVAAFGPDFSHYVDANWTNNWPGGLPNTPMPDVRRFYQDAGIRFVPEGNPDVPGLNYVWDPAFVNVNTATAVRAGHNSDWQSRDSIAALYLQGDFDLTERLKMTAGMRYENTANAVTQPVRDPNATTPLEEFSIHTFKPEYQHWFPNLQFRFEPWNRVIFRAAYSMTIGRPRISDIAGVMTVDTTRETVSFSNAGLLPQKSDNFDVSVEYYFEPAGRVGLSLFRKEINNFIASVDFTITGNKYGLDLNEFVGWMGSTKENISKGVVEGVEFDYTQQFSFLPGPLKGLGMFFNWTALSSKGDFGELSPPPDVPIKNVLPKFRPQSGNFGLSWEYGRWDLRGQWNFVDGYLLSQHFTRPSRSVYRGPRESIDIFAKYQVSPRVRVFVDILNVGPSNFYDYEGLITPARLTRSVWLSTMINAGITADF